MFCILFMCDAGVRQRLPTSVHAVSPQDHTHRRKASHVRHLWQSVQQELDVKYAHANTRWVQAVHVRILWQGISPKGQLQESQAYAQRGKSVQVHRLP